MIEVQSIEVRSSTYVEIRYLRDGDAQCLDLEYDDAGDFIDALTADPDAAPALARTAIRHEMEHA